MADNIKVKIITPKEVACDCMATAVTIPAEMGEMQALRGHISLVGRLMSGKVIVFRNAANPEDFLVEEGFFLVNAEEVSILADRILDGE